MRAAYRETRPAKGVAKPRGQSQGFKQIRPPCERQPGARLPSSARQPWCATRRTWTPRITKFNRGAESSAGRIRAGDEDHNGGAVCGDEGHDARRGGKPGDAAAGPRDGLQHGQRADAGHRGGPGAGPGGKPSHRGDGAGEGEQQGGPIQ
eukprot:3427102-Pyramimonas_sp.AAC.1